MSVTLSTTLIAVTAIIGSTVAVCFHVIGVGDFIGLVGAFGGGASGVHVVAAASSSAKV